MGGQAGTTGFGIPSATGHIAKTFSQTGCAERQPSPTFSMKLQLDQSTSQNLFTAYGPGFVEVNAQRHESSIIVGGDRLEIWVATDMKSLNADTFQCLVEIKPELVIIGTGQKFQFPAAAILRPLIDARIGYEVMDTAAACRTYNILLTEGRSVLAAIIVE